MDKAQLPFLNVVELSQLIRRREVSPVEVTQAYLERIDQVNPRLNAYITVTREEALQGAREAEGAIARGEYLGPLHGIPVAVKDQMYTRGIRTTGGARILAELVPEEDATVIARLKEAGTVLLGKLNLSEFAMGGNIVHPFGTPRNPWDLERNPGTSSSGSGAAVAASLCAAALGEDTGGSIRGPAAWCGIVGIRPTVRRISRYGVLPLCWSQDTVGPMTRTVEDCAILLGAIAGYDPKDALTSRTPVPDYRQALDGNIRGMRVGVVKEYLEHPATDPEVREAVEKAVAVLGELGASVEEISIPLMPYGGAISVTITSTEGAYVHREWIRTRPQDYDYVSRVRLMEASIVPSQVYHKALRLKALLRQQVLEALDRVDVLVLPTQPFPAPVIATTSGINSKEDQVRLLLGRRSFTGPFSAAGIPAASVSCGFTSANLPVGLQIGGRPFEEATVFKVAHAYEQNTPWHQRRPPI